MGGRGVVMKTSIFGLIPRSPDRVMSRLGRPSLPLGLLVGACAIDVPAVVKQTAIDSLPEAIAQVNYARPGEYQYRNLHAACGGRSAIAAVDRSWVAEQWCVTVDGQVLGSPVDPGQWAPLHQQMIVVRLVGTRRWIARTIHDERCPCP